jgi:hypothetical protein
MGMEKFSFAVEMPEGEDGPKAIFSQAFGALTRRVQDGGVEFRGREGEWTTDIHKAYLVPERHINDIAYYAAIEPVDGGSHSVVTMAIYPEDEKTSFCLSDIPSVANAPVRDQWQDCVAIARPIGADNAVISRAETLVLSHHGVAETATTLTNDLSRAVVCGLGQIDDKAVARLDGFGAGKAPGWQDCRRIKVEQVRRVISIAPTAAGPK